VFPQYQRSPEAKYPTAIEECYMAVKWVAEHGQEHGLDPERLAVAGDSVGGNMTAVTLLSKERGGPDILLQLLFYPVTDAGVRVTAARFQGTIHDFVMLNALAHTAAARGAIALATAWLREGFSPRLV